MVRKYVVGRPCDVDAIHGNSSSYDNLDLLESEVMLTSISIRVATGSNSW